VQSPTFSSVKVKGIFCDFKKSLVSLFLSSLTWTIISLFNLEFFIILFKQNFKYFKLLSVGMIIENIYFLICKKANLPKSLNTWLSLISSIAFFTP